MGKNETQNTPLENFDDKTGKIKYKQNRNNCTDKRILTSKIVHERYIDCHWIFILNKNERIC